MEGKDIKTVISLPGPPLPPEDLLSTTTMMMISTIESPAPAPAPAPGGGLDDSADDRATTPTAATTAATTTTVLRRDKPVVVTLRRDSLMNERTRISRRKSYYSPSSYNNSYEEKPRPHHPTHSSLKKRKSDELGSVDLSELNGFEYYNYNNSQALERSTITSPPPPPKISLDSLGNVFSDMNSRWQMAFQQQEMSRPDQQHIQVVEAAAASSSSSPPIHRLSEATTNIFSTIRKDPKQDQVEGMHNIRFTAKNIISTAQQQTPLFRHFRHHSSSSHESDSPCSVAALTRGCGACFWERSLAWSEDDDGDDHDHNDDDEDDSIVLHPSHHHKGSDIREHLSVPIHLGKEFAETQQQQQHQIGRCRNTTTLPIRRPSSSRITTLETDSRHKLCGSKKMFRQTDIDHVTEIHWEEKVIDNIISLDMMTKLSL
jgi:hypothetical protein